MKCAKCGACTVLYRGNEKGVKGVWYCLGCLPKEKRSEYVDTGLPAIIKTIQSIGDKE